MAQFEHWLGVVSAVVWGPVTLALLLGTGIFLTFGLRFMPWWRMGTAFMLLWQGRRSEEEGEITPFQALMTALSATIGTGNIAGVATAIALGGPGAVLWMWLTALFGMATKYAEAVLAVRYRERDELGVYVGGPMYYIRNGLGRGWRWLGWTFALFGTIAAFGIGNMVQANSVADAVETVWNIPHEWTGGLLMVLTGAVILGGIRRIARVASRLVPVMALAYFSAAGSILVLHWSALPAALRLIVDSAFDYPAVGGGGCGSGGMGRDSLRRGTGDIFQRGRPGECAHRSCGGPYRCPGASRDGGDAGNLHRYPGRLYPNCPGDSGKRSLG